MKNDKIIPGLVLVLIGTAFLLNNFGYIHFHWSNIIHLWPIFLVIAGVNLVFAHNNSPWATILKVAVVVGGIGLMLFGDFGNRFNFWPGHHVYYNNDNNMDDDNNDDDDDTTGTKGVKLKGNFEEPYKADIKTARLNISGAGTEYTLSDTTNQLFSADTRNTFGRYDFSHSQDDSVYVLDFKMKSHHGFNFDSDKNTAVMRLNPNPVWEIHVETGATRLDFDLSKFKVKELRLHGGAASYNVKLGAPLAMTDVDVATGVSGVDISIPKNAACSIETSSGLSDNNFDGFNKTRDNNYETPGFANAKNKMHIRISGGLSDFKVHRY
jgi:hypothetical protein